MPTILSLLSLAIIFHLASALPNQWNSKAVYQQCNGFCMMCNGFADLNGNICYCYVPTVQDLQCVQLAKKKSEEVGLKMVAEILTDKPRKTRCSIAGLLGAPQDQELHSVGAQHLSASIGEGVVGTARTTVDAVGKVLGAAHLRAAEVTESIKKRRQLYHDHNPRLNLLHNGLLGSLQKESNGKARSGCSEKEDPASRYLNKLVPVHPGTSHSSRPEVHHTQPISKFGQLSLPNTPGSGIRQLSKNEPQLPYAGPPFVEPIPSNVITYVDPNAEANPPVANQPSVPFVYSEPEAAFDNQELIRPIAFIGQILPENGQDTSAQNSLVGTEV